MSKNPTNISVTLKRTALIKAVVTEKFKEYMLFEINENIKRAQLRNKDIERLIMELSKKLNETGTQVILQQLSAEKVHLEKNVEELNGRISMIKELQISSLFLQGTAEGFVTVSEGDNLYEKLGGMEIIVKDGLIQKINQVTQLDTKSS